MFIDPRQKSGRLVIEALQDKIEALGAVEGDTHLQEDLHLCQTILQEMIIGRDGDDRDQPEWVMRGKNIAQLIKELGTFEDQNLQVRLTFDGGQTHKPISILTRRDGFAMIEYCGW
jgi:hypothetical protein